VSGKRGLGILIRLDLAKGRAFLRGASRDPIFVLAAAVAVAAIILGLRRILALEGPADAYRPLIVILGVAYLLASFYMWNSQGHLERLTAGPFQPVVATQRKAATWLTLRSAVFTLAAVGLAAIASLTHDAASTPAFLGQAAMGLVIGAVTVISVGSVMSLAGGGKGKAARDTSRRAPMKAYKALEPASLMLAWVHLRRKAGPAPLFVLAGALFALAAVAGALANQNSGPTVGVAVVLTFGLLAAILLADIDLSLVRQLGHEPLSLVRLLSLFPGPLLLVMAGGMAATLLAGLSLLFATVVAMIMGVGMLVYLVVLLLNGLVRSPPAARISAAIDVGLAVALPLMIGPWGEAWLIGRVFLLILAARRLRWRDL
jgi:hypothetical protein